MLVVMSEAQLAGLQQLYRPRKEMALDSTHGTNAYDYQLTTLMTTDEHGEGFPVAFCFSSRVDECTMRTFLTVCKDTVGEPLSDVVLMTDDTEVYHNAWCHVMGQPAHRLLCTWHIDRAWRKNLSKIHGDNALKATVYKTLRSLMELRDKESFMTKLQEFSHCAEADGRTTAFGAYFDKYYGSRPELWSYCFRLGLQVHHNMHLEALHRVLKHVHMSGRKVRRMDKCIHALLRLMRTKMHDRLRKNHKGKWTRHVLGIRNRHKKGVALQLGLVTVVEPNKVYMVKGKSEVYMVEQSETVPHTDALCPLQCADCNICIHTFACNCVDFGLRTTICKHIHLVVSGVQTAITCVPEIDSNGPSHDGFTDIEQDDADLVEFDCAAPSDTVDAACEEAVTATTSAPQLDETDVILRNLTELKPTADLQQWMHTLHQQVGRMLAQIDTVELAAAASQEINRTTALLCALKSRPQLPQLPQPLEPGNKKAALQRRFTSAKKVSRKRVAAESLSKPDANEKAFLLATLEGNVPVVSGSVEGTDHDYNAHHGDVVAFEHSY